MSTVATIGIDLAKHVVHLHGVDEHGKAVLRRRLARHEVTTFFANLPRCLVGVEAGRASHHGARELIRLGHEVRMMPPQYVKPYVKRNKTDALDAEAICEAVRRPTMRFVPVKSLDQQAILSVHRARDGLVRARTAQANQIRGLLGEFGLVVPSGIHSVLRAAEEVIADPDRGVPALLGHSCARCSSTAHAAHPRRALDRHASRELPPPPGLRSWLEGLRARRHANVAVVALANKMARIIWAVMARDAPYAATTV